MVKLSRRVIERLGLSDRIRIIKGNHLMLPIEAPVDLIMVAAQAETKDWSLTSRVAVNKTPETCHIFEMNCND